MEPVGSIQFLKDHATYPYAEPDQSSPRSVSHFLMIHFTIILSSKTFHSIYPVRAVSGSFRNILGFYDELLLAPRLTPTLKDYPLSVAGDGLFSIRVFAATVGICSPRPYLGILVLVIMP
jgi:hypothetical protein